MDCMIIPRAVSILRKKYSCGSWGCAGRVGYRQLKTKDYSWTRDDYDYDDDDDGDEDEEATVTVVVGKERKEFIVEAFVLEEIPFRVLIEMVKKQKLGKRVIFVDVDAILFEHMLWLMHNDSSSFFHLNLKEILDFYAQEEN